MSNVNATTQFAYTERITELKAELEGINRRIEAGQDATYLEGFRTGIRNNIMDLERKLNFLRDPDMMVGQGGTVALWSDCYPVTVLEVSSSGKSIKVQEDGFRRTDSNGLSEDQRYVYHRVSTNPVRTFTLRKTGRYVEQGSDAKSGPKLAVGERRAYRDPSF
jgi:hypothetical protein